MELLALIGLLLFIWLIVGPFIALGRANAARRSAEALAANLLESNRLHAERLDHLLQRVANLEAEGKPDIVAASRPPLAALEPLVINEAPPAFAAQPVEAPPATLAEPLKTLPAAPAQPLLAAAKVLPPRSPPPLPPEPPRAVAAPSKPMNFEQFMGVKMFAWVGGLALFLGIVFFVKYAFERNL
ncbi:MAG: hypothetical protein JWO94_2909, partial [Verrucomicrobiaceae bacterium]|nr:hypothetical protein [Verrucomicrobiaceae bacterium]